MSARNYSSVARATTLTGSVSDGATTFPVTDTTGFPSVPFTMVADPGRATEEIVTVTLQVGLNLTVLRGQDGTGAVPHDAGATLRHMATARDFRDAADHIDDDFGVHGVTGFIVGASDAQVLDNKTFTAGITDHTAIVVKGASGQTAPLIVFSDSSDNVLASVSATTGRLSTQGFDSNNASSFTAGSAATVPLTVKGAASQSAHLTSWKDSTNTELAFIAPTGALTAPAGTFSGAVSVGTLTSGAATTGAITATGESVFTVTPIDDVPLTIQDPLGHTANSLEVKDGAGTLRSGISGGSTNFRLFQGSQTNYVPYRTHSGVVSTTILTGNNTTSETVDLTSFGFSVKPNIFVSVATGDESALKRRVHANTFSESSTGFSIRVYQTAGEAMPDNTNYDVHWYAVQMTPSSGVG